MALARKLVVVAWRMLLTGELYRDEIGAMTQRKRAALQRLSQGGLSWEEIAPTTQRTPASLGNSCG